MELLPLVIATAELSPVLIVLNLLATIAAVRYCRPALPFVIAALLVSCWPVFVVHQVLKQGSTTSVLLECLKSMQRTSIQPRLLAMNILYYRPASGLGLRPALIDIYGGGWQTGSPQQTQTFDSYMAQQGFAVFAIDYRHAPAFRFPAQLHDVDAAVSFLYRDAAEFNLDQTRFVLCGRSSGAELALLAAYEVGPVPVKAVISYYGPTDLRAGYFDLPHPDPIHVREVLATFLGGTPSQVPNAYRDASPVNHIRASLPPTLIIQGKRDHIVKEEFARELYSRLLQSGNRAYLVEIPWSEHGFDFVFPGLGNQALLPTLHDFLNDNVGF